MQLFRKVGAILATTLSGCLVLATCTTATAGALASHKQHHRGHHNGHHQGHHNGHHKQKPVHGGVLQMAATETPGTLDPNLNTAFAEFYVAELIYGSLMRRGVTQSKIIPGDASSYTHPNPTTYIFKLRKGLKFSNGQPVTSADVKFSFERLITPKTASPWASDFQVITTIDTPTPSTVVFHLKTPFGPFLSYLSEPTYAPILSPTEVAKYGNLKSHALGTGPFKLVSYTPGVSIILKRNRHFWKKGLPYLNGIDIKIMTTTSTRLAALESGEENLAWFITARIGLRVPKSSGLKVLKPKLETNEETVIMNQTKAPFNNVKVRRAVSEAITRQKIIKVVLAGNGAVGSKIPPGEKPYGYKGPAKGLPYNTYNPKNAKKLLAKAGYKHGFSTTLNTTTVPETTQTAQLIKSQLKTVGITVHIKEETHTTLLTHYVHTTYTGMAMDLLVWQPDPDTDVYDIMYSKSAINLGKFNSPKVDKLLNKGRTQQSVKARSKTYHRLEKYVAKKAFMIFPFDRFAATQIVTSNVHGFHAENSGLHEAALLHTWLSKR